MIKYVDQGVSKIALAVLIGGIALAHPVYANDYSATSAHHHHMDPVEQRIKTIHDKLNLAPDQEDEWQDVADVMRENETDIHKLIRERRENPPTTAVQDLKSYEAIADAHTDGIKKLVPVFESFYDDLSDQQKARADKLFGRFEAQHSMHKSSSSGGRSTNNQE